MGQTTISAPMDIGGLTPISGDPRVVDASGAKTVTA